MHLTHLEYQNDNSGGVTGRFRAWLRRPYTLLVFMVLGFLNATIVYNVDAMLGWAAAICAALCYLERAAASD
jgi:hypothetical protein